MLVGFFTVFWTVYYMLEVYLSQRGVASYPVCRKGPCHWPQRSRKAREEETELESVPLCGSKDPNGVETGSEGPPTTPGVHTSDLLDAGDCSLYPNVSALGCPHQHLPSDLLQAKEGQIC